MVIALLVAAMSVVVGASMPMLAHAGTSGVTEFSIPSSSYALPNQIANGPDGNLWFSEFDGPNIGQITPSGTITEFPDPANTGGLGTNGIAAGPDGNLWFSDIPANTVGKITTAGTVTEYAALSTSNARPNLIVAGPDGNMWFTENSADFVGKITMSGAITEYPISTGAESGFIAVGPDGNLWFTEFSLGKIARVTTAGVVSEFPLASGAQPYGIATGADGNLWVTEYGTGNVDKIDPTSGAVLAQYATGASGLEGINAGPDGNMWFAAASSSLIGEVSTSGTVTEYPLGTRSQPTDVITGPDGNVWYSADNHQIGRFNTQAACLVNSASPSNVLPGGTVNAALTVSDCSGTALTNATTVSTTTPPSGCPAAPAIPSFTDTLSSGQSSPHAAAITAPTCPGDYNVVSQTTVGSTVLASATATYHVYGPGDAQLFSTPSLPGNMTAGSDGNIWVLVYGSLYQMTPAGIATPYGSPWQGGAQELVTGSDGDLYLSAVVGQNGESDIANLQLSSYGPSFKWEVPVPGTSINDLAPGPDGNVWFAGHPSVNPGGTIGFVTPAGKVKMFQLPSTDGVPVAITPGSDGGLWFLLDSGQIGRSSTAGAVTLFTTPKGTGFGGNGTATLGPDGNVWFVGSNGSGNDIVGRISPTGVVREFATLQPRAEVTGITAGADGNLWFNQPELRSCGYGSGVGRVTPSGVLTDFFASCIDTNDRFNIVAGPDGNVWNSAYYDNGVADILTGAPSACTPVTTHATPGRAAPGAKETITTVLHNCAATPGLMKLETKTIPSSSCGAPSATHLNVPLQPWVQTTSTASFTAPACAGTYAVKTTLTVGGAVVGSSVTAYTVT